MRTAKTDFSVAHSGRSGPSAQGREATISTRFVTVRATALRVVPMLRCLRVGNGFDGARVSIERYLVLLRAVEIELAALQRTLVLLSEICFGFGQRLERSR